MQIIRLYVDCLSIINNYNESNKTKAKKAEETNKKPIGKKKKTYQLKAGKRVHSIP